ncbi:LacI family DNA-binding transcriptional regulator [Christiangramia forsetii]|uniref:LacI family transcriptional regulator protein n=2 Tax=Christiangramia forsetii TaxID=411153 RepID=A0M3B8_CHRFK|nr:LacI family DNA-binding transcriptional regulator [Christiangramia forsetii]GGG26224.1 LacI family transcriptional regulator [Christiangramia forsetii]CAL67113.1 LacI family transcriptional regulator protein [Christiangramia forsetii KT0803]
MEKKVTLKELAKQLNVSISTVSKALNDSPEISPQTRKKVKELADLNYYVPNVLAQNLKTSHTKTIGVIIPAILPHFFAEALHGIETKASELGYRIIICISNESIQKEAESIKTLINGQVDGLIMSLSKETQAKMDIDHIKTLFNHKVPLVLFDRVLDQISCDKIQINDSLQAELATMELYNSGCKKIAFFSGISNTSVSNERKQGYLAALKNLDIKEKVISFDPEKFPEKKLVGLISRKEIDSVLASDELGAILVMKSALDAGYKIPKDLSVIGFTNGTMSKHFRPSLSTVDQHAQDQGKLALETMVDRIEGKLSEKFSNYTLETSIIHRDSTRRNF